MRKSNVSLRGGLRGRELRKMWQERYVIKWPKNFRTDERHPSSSSKIMSKSNKKKPTLQYITTKLPNTKDRGDTLKATRERTENLSSGCKMNSQLLNFPWSQFFCMLMEITANPEFEPQQKFSKNIFNPLKLGKFASSRTSLRDSLKNALHVNEN